MKRQIPIERDAAILTAQMISSYAGNKEYDDQGAPMYDVIHIITQDKSFLKEGIDDFVLLVAQMCSEYLVETTHNSVIVDMPTEFTDGMYQTFSKTINECLENYILSKWFLHVKQNTRADIHQKQYETLSIAANELLYTRRLPEVPQAAPVTP